MAIETSWKESVFNINVICAQLCNAAFQYCIFISFATGVVSQNLSLVFPLVTKLEAKAFDSILIHAFKADVFWKTLKMPQTVLKS